MPPEVHDPGPLTGTHDGDPSIVADERVTSAKMVDSEADQPTSMPTGQILVRESISQAASEKKEETVFEIETKAQKVQYNGLSKEVLEQERTSGNLVLRSKQAMLHSACTELRIEELEKKLHQLHQKVHALPDDWQSKSKRRMHPVYAHRLAKFGPSQFRISRATFRSTPGSRSALEVLIHGHIKDGDSHEFAPEDYQVTLQSTPERIRIRTRPLLGYLQVITGIQLSADLDIPMSVETESSTVILRPFKPFVMYEQQIRQGLRDLEAEIQKIDQPSGSRVQLAKKLTSDDFNETDLLEDLKILVQFLDNDLKPICELRRAISEISAKEIEYGDLWHLFKRGDIVMSQKNPAHAYKVINFTGGRDPLIDRMLSSDFEPTPVQGFTVDCLSILYNGSNYVPELVQFSIMPYLGRRAITSLAVYPMRLLPDYEDKRRAFVEQGQLYQQITSLPFGHKTMHGKTLDEPSHDIDGQVIVDMAYAIHAKPEWRPETSVSAEDLTKPDIRETTMRSYCGHPAEGCCGGDYIYKDLETDRLSLDTYIRENKSCFGPRHADELCDEELMLLPNWIYGFVLRTRRWAKMALSNLSEPKFENDFKNLMLPEKSKSTIRGLVLTHEHSRDRKTTTSLGSGIDLVKGKGTGLILLLHGEPGVGKTSTAECVADNTKRPLFPITCGDIGETAMEVEESLQNHFRMAHKWGCVLLLDEADIFLAKRTKIDIRRNAITSVFLRSLEYYQGILFLTTNRVGGIDPAFKSRIHMSILYRRFDLESSVRLYDMFIERTKAEQKRLGREDFTIKKKEILRFAKRHYKEMEAEGLGCWNGRQIRNAFQAAIALCEYEGQELGRDQQKPGLGKAHFETVANSSKEFDRYLIETLGAPESDIASREEWRSDQFGASREPASSTSRATAKKPAQSSGRPKGKAPAAPVELSESSSEESSGDDSDDSDEGGSRTKAPTASKQSAEEAKMEEFREFQEYKKMKSKAAKN